MVIDINIMIGRFQPLTIGHLKCIEQAYKQKHVPTVLCMIDTPDEKADAKHPFPSSLLLPLYKELLKGNKMIKDIILVKNANIVQIGPQLHENGYNIVSWTCGTDRYDSYKKMADKYHDQAMLADNFEVIEIRRTNEDVSATKVRQALLDDNETMFYKLFIPVSLSSRLKINPFEILRTQILKVVK